MKLNKFKDNIKSIRVKLFLTLAIAVTSIIVILILSNNIVLETFFLYSKQRDLLEVYSTINTFYNNQGDSDQMKEELSKIAINNNFDILIQKNNYINVYTSNREFGLSNIEINKILETTNDPKNILYYKDNISIKKITDIKTNLKYIYYYLQN